MKILALDQAIRTSGYAIFDNNKLIKYDKFSIKTTLPIEQRLGAFWNQLNNLYHDYEFDYLAFEDIQLQAGNVETYKKLSYLQSAIILWCYFNDIKFSILAPSHWRSLICSKGWGRKREEQKEFAINWVREQYGIEVDSDTADAICIGYAAIQEKRNTGSAF